MKLLIAMLVVGCFGCSPASNSVAQSVLAVSPGDQVTAEQQRDANGSYRLSIKGERYDGRPLIKALIVQLGSADDGGWLRNADVEVDVATFSGFGGAELHGVALHLVTSSGRIQKFEAAAGDLQLAGTLSDTTGGQTITLRAAEAGLLLRALGLYGRVSGGQFLLMLRVPTDVVQPTTGQVSLLNFAVEKEPLFADLQRWKGNGEARFTQMHLSIRLAEGHLVIDRGFACSKAMATEIRGIADFVTDQMDMDGHLLFAFGDGPLGDLSKENLSENAMFMNFRSRGPIDAPRVQINHSIPVVLARELMRSCFGSSPHEPG